MRKNNMKEFGIEKINKKLAKYEDAEDSRKYQLGETVVEDYRETQAHSIMEIELARDEVGYNPEEVKEYIKDFDSPLSEASIIFENLKGLNDENLEERSVVLEQTGVVSEKILELKDRISSLAAEKKKRFFAKGKRALARLATISAIAAPFVTDIASGVNFSDPNTAAGAFLGGVALLTGGIFMERISADKIDESKKQTKEDQIAIHRTVMNRHKGESELAEDSISDQVDAPNLA